MMGQVCGPGSLSGGWLVLFATFYITGLAGIQQVEGSAGCELRHEHTETFQHCVCVPEACS